MKEIKIIPLSSNKKSNYYIFKILLLLNIIHFCLFEICIDRKYPYLLNEECVQSCKNETFNSNLCILDNEIIKSQ